MRIFFFEAAEGVCGGGCELLLGFRFDQVGDSRSSTSSSGG